MKYHIVNGMRISELTIGTVQLGMDYSINSGKPDLQQSLDILKRSRQLGITILDTAREYGNSEEVIGTFMKDYPDTLVVSKFKISPENLREPKSALKEVRRSVEQSKRALGLERIPILLFHKGPEHRVSDTCRVIPGILSELKKEGDIKMGGVSVFDVSEIPALSVYEEVEAFQIPLNIMDHRLFKSDIYKGLLSKEKIVFVRSVFLKGLFFKDPKALPETMNEAVPYLEMLNALAEKYDMSMAQLALSYVRDLDGVTSLVIGADNPEQVHQNVELMKGPELRPELRGEIDRAFRNVPERIITPHTWNF